MLKLAIIRTDDLTGELKSILLVSDLHDLAAAQPRLGRKRLQAFLAQAERDLKQRTVTLT